MYVREVIAYTIVISKGNYYIILNFSIEKVLNIEYLSQIY